MGEVARLFGKPLMPWQQYVADVVLEIDPDTGELVYDEWGLTVPRQSGKSTLLLAKAVHRASATGFFGRRQKLVYTAQTRIKAREKFEEDYAPMLAESGYFRSRSSTHWGNGNEHIRFANGSRFGIEANTEKSGHGGTIDEAFIDEAFAQADGRLEQAFSPAMLIPRNTQLGWISTAGWVDGSPYLEAKAKRGREQVEMGVRTGLAYFEWSAPADADPADEDLWATYMPALGHTITPAKIRSRLVAASSEGKLNDFRRAYMNLWVPKSSFEEPVIGDAQWAAHRADTRIAQVHAIALAVSPLERESAIAVCGVSDAGRTQVQLSAEDIDGEPWLDYRRGTDWVVARLQSLSKATGVHTVYLVGRGTRSLQPDIERAGLTVETLSGADMASASGLFYDEATAPAGYGIAHVGQLELDRAVREAQRADTDEGWRWSYKKSAADISPLVAATAALWAHTSAPRPQFFAARR